MNSPIRSTAILGRGIAGLMAAYKLQASGIMPTVIGRKGAGDQASRAAQGVLCNKGLIFFESPLFQSKVESLSRMKGFLDELERVSGSSLPRFFEGVDEPIWSALDYQATVSRIYRHKFWGCHGTIWRGPWAKSRESSKLPLGSLHYPQDGWFDPIVLLDVLEAYLVSLGVIFLDDEAQDFALDEGGAVTISLANGTKFAFDQIVLATGAGSENLLKTLDIAPLKTFLIGGQSLRFKALADAHAPHIAVKGNQSLAIHGRTAILGSTSWQGFHCPSLKEDAKALREKTEVSFGYRFEGEGESRSGTRIRFKDRMPLVGWISQGQFARKIYLLTGFYKNGMHLAELCAEEMLLDLTGKGKERRYQGFSPQRFSI